MNKLKIIILLIVTTLVPKQTITPTEFHIKVSNIKEVKKFHENYPNIVTNKAVYIAYLNKYYNGNEEQYCNLINNDK